MASQIPDPVARPARKRGPKTAAGKARSSRNALKHGLRARRLVLLQDEDAAAFAAFEAAVRADLAPAGALEADLVTRLVTAAWRARRADRLEAALLGIHLADARSTDLYARQTALGYGLMRDCYGPRVMTTLVRYRGSILAELFRSLAALQALRTQVRDVTNATPAVLELTGAKNQMNSRNDINKDIGRERSANRR
jgi:hypothetical protein